MTRKTPTSQKLGILLETATTTINPPETQRRGELCLLCLQKVPTAPFPGLLTWLFTFDDVWSQSYFRIWLLQWPPWCLRKCVDSLPTVYEDVPSGRHWTGDWDSICEHISPSIWRSQFQAPTADLSLLKNSSSLHSHQNRWILHPVAECMES